MIKFQRKELLIDWVRDCLCPVLGKYIDIEKNSIVIMDNALTHMCEEIEELMKEKVLICST